MGHYQKMEKFRKAKSKKYEKKIKVQFFGLSLIILLTRALGNNIESLQCFTRAITHQGIVLLHATHAKMSVQSQITFFIKQSVNRFFIILDRRCASLIINLIRHES